MYIHRIDCTGFKITEMRPVPANLGFVLYKKQQRQNSDKCI